MRHPEEDIDKTLERLLRKIGDPDADQMEQRVGAVAHALQSAVVGSRAPARRFGKLLDSSQRRRFAAAAVLIVAVAIGVYAARRSGLIPKAPKVTPAAQRPTFSVNPAPASGPATIGAAVGGSKEPAVTRGGREPLRTAAEEIAFLQGTDTGARRLEFAAASVRQFYDADDHLPGVPMNCRGVDGELFPVPTYSQNVIRPTPQGRCLASRARLDLIIGRAFTSSPLRVGQAQANCCVIGVPDWRPPFFEIQATAENPSRVTKAELQQMLQALLIDRFKLRLRRETREQNGYVLTVAKSGIKLRETSGPEQSPGLLVLGIDNTERTRINQDGGLLPQVMKGKFTIPALVGRLESWITDKPVGGGNIFIEDKTGLTSIYDMTLNVSRVRLPGGTGPRGEVSAAPPPEWVPPLPKALEEQLGLHLEPAKVRVEYLIIEHIETPSEN